ASPDIDKNTRAAARQIRSLDRAAGHSNFVLLSSFLRHSCFVIRRRETCAPRIEPGTGIMIVRPRENGSGLVLGKWYLAVHDGSVRCLFYSQCSTGKFRPLSHHS